MNYFSKLVCSLPKHLSTLLISALLAAPLLSMTIAPSKANASGCGGDLDSFSVFTSVSARIGGVALDQAAVFLADMTDITGAYYDPAQDRIVFVGKTDTAAPKFDKEDMAVAMKSIFINNAIPALSLEFKNPNDLFSHPNLDVVYYGGIEDTKFGQTLLDADYRMKIYSQGYEANGQPVQSTVPGYKSFFKRYLEKNPNPNLAGYSRFWITPQLMTLKRDATNNTFVFDQTKMQVETEGLNPNNDPAWNQAATEFAAQQTQLYDQFAAESPSYAKTKQLAKLVSVVKWIKDNNVPTDLTWARNYQPQFVSTPREVPRLTTPEVAANGYMWQITGGVVYDTPNTYNADDGTARNVKTASEAVPASSTDVHWTFSQAGQNYDAVAVNADAFRSLGAYSTSVTDLALPTPGDVSLDFSRTYSSFNGGNVGLGRGWDMLPARLTDLKPGYISGCVPSTGYTGQYPVQLALDTADGGRETFSYACDLVYHADEPGFHSQMLRNTDGSYTARLKDQSEYIFDINMKLIATRDENGNTITYSYDSQQRLINVKDASNRGFNLSYGPQGLISQVADTTGRIVKYTYANGNLSTITDPKNSVSEYGYDTTTNKVTAVKDRTGLITDRLTYNPEGKIATHRDANGNNVTYSYDNNLRTISLLDGLGRTSQIKYDAKGRILENTDALGKKTVYTYGNELSPLTITDKKGFKTTNVFDANGNITSITLPDGKKVVNTYDAKNRLTKLSDERYKATSTSPPKDTLFAYDAKGNITELTENGAATQFTYDSKGNTLSIKDRLNQTTTQTYDSFGNVLSETNPLGKVTTYTYDTTGRLTRVTDPDNKIENYTYDANDNIVSAQNAAGTTTHTYDKVDRVTKVTLPNTGSIQYAYNMAGNITATTDQANEISNFTFDSYGNLKQTKDPLQRNIDYAYDSLNQATEEKTASGKTVKWEYDANGNITKRTDGANRAITYTYDNLNRLTKITYPDATTATYVYDSRGNLTSMTDPSGTTTYKYDLFDRMIEQKDPYGKIVTYKYDAEDNLIESKYPDNKIVTYTYDTAGRLASMTDWNLAKTTYTYSNNGNLASRTLPNGVVTNYTYDTSNRLSSLEHLKGTMSLGKYVYERNAQGEITKSTENSTAAPTAAVSSFGYNLLSQLTSAVYPDSGNYAYTFDKAYNRLTEKLGTNTTNYNYNNDNQLTSVGATNYTYDANGNTIKKEVGSTIKEYTYDFTDKLTKETTLTPGTGFAYTQVTAILGGIDIGSDATPAWADLDNDGDQDLLIGESGGKLKYYRNTGSATNLVLTADTTFLSSVDVGSDAAPAFADIDNDGDRDLIIGNSSGNFSYLQNTGSVTSPTYPTVTSNYSGIDVGSNATPFLVDIDSDGDRDLFSGNSSGKILYYRNTGSVTAPAFTANTTLFANDDAGSYSAPTFLDLDGDNDQDALVGESGGKLKFYRNTGSVTTPAFTAAAFLTDSIDIGSNSTPVFTDSDGDSDRDLFIGNSSGVIAQYNAGPPAPTPGPANTYKYDSLGNRLEKSVGGAITRYVNDTTNSLTYVLAEMNSANTLQNFYAYGLGLVSSGGAGSTSRQYNLEDGLGNVRLVTNNTGAVLNNYAYDPYGNNRATTGTTANNYTFASEQRDSETGLTYLRARYYDPTSGRFTTKDPIIGSPLIPVTLNPYVYAGNDPINLDDPSGLSSFDIGGGCSSMGANVGTVFSWIARLGSAGWKIVRSLGKKSATKAPKPVKKVSSPAKGTTGKNTSTNGTGKSTTPAKNNNNWGNSKTLQDHFDRHGADFGAKTPDQYAKMARDFLKRSQQKRLPTKLDKDGTIRTYDPKSNTFGSYNRSGTTKTFYKPTDGAKYWSNQPGTSPW